jgi:hypothetical protein
MCRSTLYTCDICAGFSAVFVPTPYIYMHQLAISNKPRHSII